jgi:outer membrane murein-binding lipoprotein Lpp
MMRLDIRFQRPILCPQFAALVAASLVVVFIVAGCSANAQSRQLATQLRQLTAEYNAASTAKIEAEQTFYLASVRNMQSTLNKVDPTASAPNVTLTLAYGRIVTTTNSASLKLAGDLIDGTGSASVAPKITAFVQDGIVSENQAFSDARQEEAQAVQAMATDFNTLEQYQATLSTLSQQLSELEQPTPFTVRASELEVFGQAVAQQLKSQPSQTK